MELKPGYKKTEVGVIPEEWNTALIGALGTVVRGGSPRPAGDPRYFNGNFIPWLTVAALTNISEHKLYVSETVGYLTEEGAQHSRLLNIGTLIIANSGATLGVAKILEITCCANDGVAAIIDQRVGDKEFICHYINSRTKHLREVVATGNGQPNLNTALIQELTVPLPSAREQRLIAAALSDVDALLAKLDQLIAKKRDLKQATMQQLLTGRTRLPGYSGAWVKKQLGDLATFYKGKGLPKSELDSFGVEPCIHYGELFTSYPESIMEVLSHTSTNHNVFRSVSNDVLMPTSDVTPNGLAIASSVHQSGVILGGDILVIRVSPKELNGSFLSYIIRQSRDQIMQLVSGTTVFHLYGTDMKRFTFSMPQVEEQQAGVKVLDDMDADIAALEARRDKTRALKQGMMQELLTGRIRLVDPEDSELNALADARLADGQAWIKVSLDEL